VSSLYLQRGFAPLEKNYRLLFIDTRGSGESSRPADPGKMSGADMADDLEHLRTYLGLGTIRLLGHSDSASIVLDYAERYPAEVSGLVFVDGVAHGKGVPIQEERAQADEMIKELSGDPRYQRALAASTEPNPATDAQMMQSLKDTMPLYFADLRNMSILRKDLKGTVPSSWALKEHAKANAAYPWHQEEQLDQVRAGTLIIVGKQDRLCPPLVAEHVHQGIGNSKLVEIDGSGHFPWIEQPSQFFKAIADFLQGH
jgi:pimeloyl-ACP methyl ester carboxylesterase